MPNCKQCGGAMDLGSSVCPYCGSLSDDFTHIFLNKPLKVSVTENGKELTFTVKLDKINLSAESNDTILYTDNEPYMVISSPEMRLDMSGYLIPSECDGNKPVILTERIIP